MKAKIEHPHVFISYAWGSRENQERVIEFAQSLMQCGINVELDKWSLKEGNDTYAFMEQMVNNPDITNVLILLDENYTKKANERKGGVGTETQILSPEIYNKVKQEKFIPIVFKRGANGEISKPTFLKEILHFDLSEDENYSSEFKRLVKRLFGIEIFKKPEIGKAPAWLEENDQNNNPKVVFSKISGAKSDKEKQFEIRNAFEVIKDSILDHVKSKSIDSTNYIESYKQLQSFRNDILSLVKFCLWFDNIGKEVSTFLESLKNTRIDNGVQNEAKDTLVHEIFVYIVGVLLKAQNYDQLGYIVNKTYFPEHLREDPTSFNHFYMHNPTLDNAVVRRDNKPYHCGTAQLWMETIAIDYLTMKEFVAADVLLYNIAIYGNNYIYHWIWFPITYVYDDYNGLTKDFCKRMASNEFLDSICVIFGYDNGDSFASAIKDKEANTKDLKEYRYSGAWREAPMLTDFIGLGDIGKYK